MSDLGQKVLDFFESKYGGAPSTNLGAGNLFLAFEAVGLGILPASFRVNPGDPDPNPLVVHAYEGGLVDFTPEIDAEGHILPQTDLSLAISHQYESLLNGARVRPGLDPAAFLQLLGHAQTEFQNQGTSFNLVPYWRASLSPNAWYDDRDLSTWSDYEYAEGDVVPQPPPGPSKGGGAWNWRVGSPMTQAKLQQVAAVRLVPNKEVAKTQLAGLNLGAFVIGRQAVTGPDKPKVVTPVANMKAVNLGAFAVGKTVKADAAKTVSVPAKAQASSSAARHPADIARDKIILSLPTKTPTSKDFKVSFKYRVVDIQRPWLSADFLRSPDWYLPGSGSGSVAAGKYTSPAGPLGYLPAKFIVTRDVKITANWSQEDRALAAGKGVSFGPFTFVNSKFENNTLTDPGMRIIGWLCQVVPLLPPIPDPALPAPVEVG